MFPFYFYFEVFSPVFCFLCCVLSILLILYLVKFIKFIIHVICRAFYCYIIQNLASRSCLQICSFVSLSSILNLEYYYSIPLSFASHILIPYSRGLFKCLLSHCYALRDHWFRLCEYDLLLHEAFSLCNSSTWFQPFMFFQYCYSIVELETSWDHILSYLV